MPATNRSLTSAAKNKGAPGAMKRSRPDRTASKETDARGPSDRDGNEAHAEAIAAKGKPARGRK